MLIFCHHIGASRAVLSLHTNLTSDVCLASLSVAQLDPAQQHPPHLHPLILIFQRSGPCLWEAKRAGKKSIIAATALRTHFARAGTRGRSVGMVLLLVGSQGAEFDQLNQ